MQIKKNVYLSFSFFFGKKWVCYILSFFTIYLKYMRGAGEKKKKPSIHISMKFSFLYHVVSSKAAVGGMLLFSVQINVSSHKNSQSSKIESYLWRIMCVSTLICVNRFSELILLSDSPNQWFANFILLLLSWTFKKFSQLT